MATTEKKDNKKTVYKETDRTNEELNNGETSSVAHFDRASVTKTATRKNKPLGASHEPGTTPGTEI